MVLLLLFGHLLLKFEEQYAHVRKNSLPPPHVSFLLKIPILFNSKSSAVENNILHYKNVRKIFSKLLRMGKNGISGWRKEMSGRETFTCLV
jgi:hypothetical protein